MASSRRNQSHNHKVSDTGGPLASSTPSRSRILPDKTDAGAKAGRAANVSPHPTTVNADKGTNPSDDAGVAVKKLLTHKIDAGEDGVKRVQFAVQYENDVLDWETELTLWADESTKTKVLAYWKAQEGGRSACLQIDHFEGPHVAFAILEEKTKIYRGGRVITGRISKNKTKGAAGQDRKASANQVPTKTFYRVEWLGYDEDSWESDTVMAAEFPDILEAWKIAQAD